MTPIATGAGIVETTMQHLLPAKFDGRQARVLLLAIGLQESDFVHRKQISGPARSFWGFEQGGGIRGVLEHSSSRPYARAICGLRAVAPVSSDVYAAFLTDDPLACAFARLLLWTDAEPLPQVVSTDTAFAYYLRNWRPGAYKRDPAGVEARWAASHAAAVAAIA